MSTSELKRLLKKLGCTFSEGTNHTFAHHGTKSAPLPRHPAREVKKGTVNAILAQLGLKTGK